MKYLLIIWCSLALNLAQAQVNDSSFSLIRTYKGDITGAALDNLDNLYIISSTGQIKKFGAQGDSLGVFNGIRNYGKLSSIDVSNPLKPLLFYKDFSTVVVLDRFLARRTSLNLRTVNILQPSTIGLSYDNNIWVFDQYDNKLKKIDETGSVLLETVDFRNLFDKGISPQKIINDNGLVYLADSAAGIFVFDNYGSFKRKIILKDWSTIDVWKGMIVRFDRDAVTIYNPATFIEKRLPLPSSFKPYIYSQATGNKFINFSTNSLQVFSVKY